MDGAYEVGSPCITMATILSFMSSRDVEGFLQECVYDKKHGDSGRVGVVTYLVYQVTEYCQMN